MQEFSTTVSPGSVSVRGEVDMAVAPDLRRALDESRHEDGCKLIIDLSAVSFVDSSGINELLRVHTEGHPIVVRSASESVRRTLEMLGLHEVFTLDS